MSLMPVIITKTLSQESLPLWAAASLIGIAGAFWLAVLLIRRLQRQMASRTGSLKKEIEARTLAEEGLKKALAEANQRRAEIEALLAGAQAILQQNDFETVTCYIFEKCKGLIGATCGYGTQFSTEGQEDRLLFLDGYEATMNTSLPMPLCGLGEEASRTGRVIFENNFMGSAWTQFLPEGHTPIENVLFVPLSIGGTLRGLLGLANKPGGFTENDTHLAAAFGELITIALHNSQTTNRLRESEQNYRTLANSGQALIWTAGPDALCNYFNDTWLEFTGRTLEQEMGDGWSKGVHPDDLQRCLKIYLEAFHKREPFNMEYRLHHRSGEYRWIQDRGSPCYSSNREFIGYIGHCLDITEHKQAEEQLAEKQKLLETVTKMIPDVVYLYNTQQGRHIYMNKDVGYLLGYSSEEIIAAGANLIIGAVHPDDMPGLRKHIETLAHTQSEEIYDIEYRIRGKQGDYLWFYVREQVYQRDEHGQPRILFGICQDATARKQAETDLRVSLEEKEILLKEVHHRVKNNLASISALISLQSEQIVEANVASEFTDLSQRVQSMALVHELLYQNETLSQIDMQNYLDTLVARLHTSYRSQAIIRWEVAAQGVTMNLDNAIPCGLIVNELVTNAFKYAFPAGKAHAGEQECRISIQVSWDGQAYSLLVNDNGAGFPPGFNWQEAQSLGMQLVMLLGRHQLNGQIELHHAKGTAFRLRFIPKEHTRR